MIIWYEFNGIIVLAMSDSIKTHDVFICSLMVFSFINQLKYRLCLSTNRAGSKTQPESDLICNGSSPTRFV